MKKDLLLAGAMRAGKTFLAGRMTDRFIPIQTDFIILALQSAHADLGIGRHGASYDELCDAFSPFLINYAFQLSQDSKRRYLLDCHYIRPRDIALLPESFQAIFLGYPDVTAEHKMAQLRSLEDCYTHDFSDESLHIFLTRWIEQSRCFQSECELRNIPFLDTSYDLSTAVSYLDKMP